MFQDIRMSSKLRSVFRVTQIMAQHKTIFESEVSFVTNVSNSSLRIAQATQLSPSPFLLVFLVFLVSRSKEQMISGKKERVKDISSQINCSSLARPRNNAKAFTIILFHNRCEGTCVPSTERDTDSITQQSRVCERDWEFQGRTDKIIRLCAILWRFSLSLYECNILLKSFLFA